MSASLVGSEMCIRDRFKAARREAVASRPDERALAWQQPRIAWIPDWRICLLYTSDAADDM
eukprot:12652210-Alexandrium_andersonii.AAC.1